MDQYQRAGTWYRPGNWSLPEWWTNATGRGVRLTHTEQEVFYNGQFVREVLGHEGGMTTTPKVETNEG